MGKKDLLQRSLDAGRDAGSKTQERVEALLSELVKVSETQAEQARELLTELVERSKLSTEQVRDTVDREVRAQVANLGLATQADIRRLEDRIAALGTPARKKAAARKAPAKKAAARKAPAKKAPARRSAT